MPRLGLWGDERVRPGEVLDPHLPLFWLVEVEPPDPRVDEVVCGALPGDAERLESPPADARSTMRQTGHSEAPVWVQALEVSPERIYQAVLGRAVIVVVGPPQFLQVKGANVPRLLWSQESGRHDLPVLNRKGARRGGPP